MSRSWVLATVLLGSLPVFASGQSSSPWHDPSPHTVQFVTVDQDVKLEVLDWGGSGKALVLLAGLGGTAHVYDDFAPKLTSEYHVYGITRRGFGASSAPATGYSADRLADDVLAVLDALKIPKPVLVGHSIAGEELSSLGTRHPERLAGLIYLDAAYSYAFYAPSLGDWNIDLQELLKELDKLQFGKRPADPKPVVNELLEMSLPGFEKDLQEMQKQMAAQPVVGVRPPVPGAADRQSFEAFRLWQEKVSGDAPPEAELRQQQESTPDGHVGGPRTKPAVSQAIVWGEQKYTAPKIPVLAIFAIPHDWGPAIDNNAALRASMEIADQPFVQQVEAFESAVPSAKVVRLPNSSHLVFISKEADVLREMRSFLETLHE